MGMVPSLVEALLASVDAGILICEADGTLLHYNSVARDLLAWPEAFAPGSLSDLDAVIGACLSHALAGEVVRGMELNVSNGAVSANACRYFDADGNRTGAILTLHDRRGQSRMVQVLEMIGDAFILLDPKWRYTYVNAKAVEFAGKSRESLIGKSVWEEFPEAVNTAFYRELHRAVEENQPVHFENHFTPLGKWFENDAYPSPEGVSVFYRDVTLRKRSEHDLLRNAEELARSNADLQQFTYAVSHDLQEPLRTVNTYAQMLEKRFEGKMDADSEELLAGISESSTRMREMIRDLLVYSRVTQGGTDDGTGPVDLQEVLEWALENLRIAIDESGATITNDPLPVLTGVEIQLRQLFQNLLGNAMKYRSTEPLLLHIGARCEGREWVVTFRDNGLGIPASDRERIFGLFKRGQSGSTKSGTGVGLALCRRIALRHHGSLDVESEPGKGSTFSLRLPVEP